MRQYQGRHIPLGDNIRHRKGLARPRHAQQCLLALTLRQTIHQLSNRRRLVAGGLIFRNEMKTIHTATIVAHIHCFAWSVTQKIPPLA